MFNSGDTKKYARWILDAAYALDIRIKEIEFLPGKLRVYIDSSHLKNPEICAKNPDEVEVFRTIIGAIGEVYEGDRSSRAGYRIHKPQGRPHKNPPRVAS